MDTDSLASKRKNRFARVRYSRIRVAAKPSLRIVAGTGAHVKKIDLSVNAIQFRTAWGRADFEGAFELLQRRYCESGLASGRQGRLRVRPFHFWEQTQVFVAVQNESVIGCLTLISDTGSKSLPIDSAYPAAIQRLRREGERVCEIACLAIEPSGSRSSTKIFVELTRRMRAFAWTQGLTRFAAVVHPRHAKFYRHAMGFQTIGAITRQSLVEGQPGVPIMGFVNDPSVFRDQWRQYYFDRSVEPSDIEPRPMSPIDREYFRRDIQPAPKIRQAA